MAAPSGGPWGGTSVDRNFYEFLLEMFGKEVVSAFSKDCKSEELDMHRMFECKKRSVRTNCETINMVLSNDLYDIFEKTHNQKFDDYLSRSSLAKTVKKRKTRLHIDGSVFHKMFAEAKENVLVHMEKELSSPKLEGVKNIIMVGGFSEADIMKKAVRDKFCPYGYEVIVPEDAGLAVVKGCVLFLY